MQTEELCEGIGFPYVRSSQHPVEHHRVQPYINPTEIYLELYKHNKHYGRINTFQNGLTVKFPIDPKTSLKIAQFFSSIPGVENVCYSYDPAAARVMHLVVKHHFKLRPYMPFQC